MNCVAAPRLRITVTVYPKARGLALGLTITAAPQLIARLTQVTLRNAVDYSSILLPSPSGRGNATCQELFARCRVLNHLAQAVRLPLIAFRFLAIHEETRRSA